MLTPTEAVMTTEAWCNQVHFGDCLGIHLK